MVISNLSTSYPYGCRVKPSHCDKCSRRHDRSNRPYGRNNDIPSATYKHLQTLSAAVKEATCNNTIAVVVSDPIRIIVERILKACSIKIKYIAKHSTARSKRSRRRT